MGTINFKGSPVNTSGDLPAVGSKAPDFFLVNTSLQAVTLADFAGKKKVLNIFPSVDTGICALSVKAFNAKAGSTEGVVVLNISRDLPFAHKRFCGAEGVENVESLSTFRSDSFTADYGLEMTDGPLVGLCSRAVVVLDADNNVIYTEQVPDIVQEPNYDAALKALS